MLAASAALFDVLVVLCQRTAEAVFAVDVVSVSGVGRSF
jgi:hypothetical protein